MWEDTVELDRPQMALWRMRTACWVAKSTNAHSEYVMLIAFPRQQGLRERSRALRCTCIVCLVNPLKMKHSPLRSSPYRAVNTLRLGYKNQSVNVV